MDSQIVTRIYAKIRIKKTSRGLGRMMKVLRSNEAFP